MIKINNFRGDSSNIAAKKTSLLLACRGVGSDVESSDDEGDDGTGEMLEEAEVAIGGDDDVELDPAEWGIGAAAGNPEADETLTEVEDATARLAVVDLDWHKMRAVDVFSVLRSFLGKGTTLQKVVVYVSDYGREQMAREKEDGPQGLRPEKSGPVCYLPHFSL